MGSFVGRSSEQVDSIIFLPNTRLGDFAIMEKENRRVLHAAISISLTVRYFEG